MKGKTLLVTIMSMSLALTGCWNSSDLTEFLMSSAVGIDYIKDSDEYRVTFQVINPREVANIEGTRGRGSAVTVYSNNGKNILEAIGGATSKVPRKVFLAHIRLIVLSEELITEKGIKDIIDLFARDHEFRKNIDLLIAREDNAEDILQVKTQTEVIPAQRIFRMLDVTEQFWGEERSIQLIDLLSSINNKGKELAISGIQILGNKETGKTEENLQQVDPPANLRINGMAVLKEGKLQRWLNGTTARGLQWATGDIKSTVINLPCKGKEDRMGIEIKNAKVNIKLENTKEVPSFQVNITANGNVGEANCALELATHDELANIEQQLNKEIKDEVMRAIEATKDVESDVIGFGDKVKRSDPKKWKEMEGKWGQLYRESDIKVTVDSFIRGTGLKMDPFQQQ